MELREQILEGTLQVFNYKGMKFTMDDIAHNLGISKKTIYTVFKNKEEMFLELVDYLFDGIKEEELRIYEDDSLSTVEKVRMILGVLPGRRQAGIIQDGGEILPGNSFAVVPDTAAVSDQFFEFHLISSLYV